MNKVLSFKTALALSIFVVLTNPAVCQKVLILENGKTFKNHKYFQGSVIRLELKTSGIQVFDEIDDMTDSSLFLSDYGEIELSDIRYISRDRWFIGILSAFSMVAGAAYFGIDSFNRLINSEWPMVDTQTLAISTGLVGLGFMLIPFRYHRITIGEKWKVRVIDPGGLK